MTGGVPGLAPPIGVYMCSVDLCQWWFGGALGLFCEEGGVGAVA